ncbi:MAG: molybdopterin oxidoreductase, partial [Anaerolineales bacterium]
VGILINVGMWFERYIIIPISLTINRMPFTWRMYTPGIEIPLGIGTLVLFILLYVIFSKLIPMIPVWEVQEGQMAHQLKKFGRETVVQVSELE